MQLARAAGKFHARAAASGQSFARQQGSFMRAMLPPAPKPRSPRESRLCGERTGHAGTAVIERCSGIARAACSKAKNSGAIALQEAINKCLNQLQNWKEILLLLKLRRSARLQLPRLRRLRSRRAPLPQPLHPCLLHLHLHLHLQLWRLKHSKWL